MKKVTADEAFGMTNSSTAVPTGSSNSFLAFPLLWVRTLTKTLAVPVCILIGAISPVDAKEKDALSGSQIKKIMPGNYTLVIYGFDIRVSASGDGGLVVRAFGDELKGRWSVKGDKLCVSVKDGDRTEIQCSSMTYDGKKWFSAAGLNFYAK